MVIRIETIILKLIISYSPLELTKNQVIVKLAYGSTLDIRTTLENAFTGGDYSSVEYPVEPSLFGEH